MARLRRYRDLIVLGLLAFGACSQQAAPTSAVDDGGVGPAAEPAPPAPSFEQDGHPFIERHCLDCHHSDEPTEGVAFDPFTDEEQIRKAWRMWELAGELVRDGEMPPAKRPRPENAERERFLEWLDSVLATIDRSAPPDPGRVTLKRLSRIEYENTIRDLLGISIDASEWFPADDVGYGFDRIGDVLAMPPLLLEKYVAAAEVIAADTIVSDDPANPPTRRLLGVDCRSTGRGGVVGSGARVLSTNGEVYASFDLPRDGEYVVRVGAWGQQAGPDSARMRLRAANRSLATVDVAARRGDLHVEERTVRLGRGPQRVGAAFINDYWKPKDPDPAQRDRNLVIEWIEVVGPVDARVGPLPEPHRRVIFETPGDTDTGAVRERILRRLADRAFRRPATDDEVARLAALAVAVEGTGEPFEGGIRVALTAVLSSPHFLFRVELHAAPDDPSNVQLLDDWALASRLSYFLWSSMPDAELRAAADAGRLRADLDDQVDRMLADARADALVTDFAGQWLQLRTLDDVEPDPQAFPYFSDALRNSMRRESEALVREVLRENQSVLELLRADHTYVDGRLARLYGIDGVSGDEFVRVDYPDARRAGVLGHASVLTLTSYPTRTSPVKRGKWLLEQVSGSPTPPPPPGADDLPEAGEQGVPASLRERLAQHRADEACAVCHDRLDPLGFALENFDGIGRWREMDGDVAIDPNGSLPDGRALDGPASLREALLEGDAFPEHLTATMLTYALGRGPLPSDVDVVERIVEDARPGGYRLHDLVRGVVASVPFRMVRGEEVAE